jgi:glucose/arabinose dehydrogenase
MVGEFSRTRGLSVVLGLAVAAVVAACAPNVPDGFHEYTVFSGLNQPTGVEFSPDGRVFVAEKRGLVRVFDNVDDPSPATVADLRTNVFNGWDRGLLGLALPPDFPANQSIYVLYTYDAPPGGQAPRWGTPGADVDNCPDPPGYTGNGCVVTGRLSRLPLAGGRWTGEEDVLIHDWCQQYPSHSVGALEFGRDGALYVSGGEGASFTFVDYGQRGSPVNPCGDPPGGVGTPPPVAQAEGGALRSQDIRTGDDPTGLGGAVIRIDPETGEALPDNPRADSPDPNTRRIVAHGFRNPFRFALRPGTDELWIGDVGWDTWEEVNRTVGDDTTVDNFGWPCYEGSARMPRYEGAEIWMCKWLYLGGPGEVRTPYWSYRHGAEVRPGDRCEEARGSSVSGVTFAPADSAYPDSYDGALFVADAPRRCIWVMFPGTNGLPDPPRARQFVAPAGTPVELEFGPGGDLWYVDLEGSIKRVGYTGSNHVPVPALTARPTSGDPPLTVTFDGRGSSDEDAGDVLRFAWDLDGDGLFDDGAEPVVTHTFTDQGVKVARLRVTDSTGASAVGLAVVTVGSSRVPAPVIEEPADMLVAPVGGTIRFRGSATDADGDPVPASGLSWRADLLHCPSACHRHADVFGATGVASGSFVVPDHEHPTTIELHLTARADGESATVTRSIVYQWTDLTVASQPAGVSVTAGGHTGPAPYTRPFATAGRVTLTAPGTATIGGVRYAFASWSDGGARTHEIVVPPAAATYTARYTRAP